MGACTYLTYTCEPIANFGAINHKHKRCFMEGLCGGDLVKTDRELSLVLTSKRQRSKKGEIHGAETFGEGSCCMKRAITPQATALFTRALDSEGPFSSLGGEIQLWLALAYQVCIDNRVTLHGYSPTSVRIIPAAGACACLLRGSRHMCWSGQLQNRFNDVERFAG